VLSWAFQEISPQLLQQLQADFFCRKQINPAVHEKPLMSFYLLSFSHRIRSFRSATFIPIKNKNRKKIIATLLIFAWRRYAYFLRSKAETLNPLQKNGAT
jgi:hypothetical protein